MDLGGEAWSKVGLDGAMLSGHLELHSRSDARGNTDGGMLAGDAGR